MLGIEQIAVHLPTGREFNRDLIARFEVEDSFLTEKIGVLQRAMMGEEENTSDLALAALEKLIAQETLPRDKIEAIALVTQNPDTNLPHVSALVHGRAGLAKDCAAFDLSLGCSGYVYGLSIFQSFLAANGLTRGVLITCDPYSKIVAPDDRNTVLLFGDAATATLIGPNPRLTCGPFTFGTRGDMAGALVTKDGKLHMNGREVFNFAAQTVPKNVEELLEKAGLTKDEVDCYVLHQGSRYIVETLAKRLGVERSKVPVDIENMGNTVSSSIPILLQQELANHAAKTLVLCGFGVGLSWASCVCTRVGE